MGRSPLRLDAPSRAGLQRTCAPATGQLRTTYLSDLLWITRSYGAGGVTVLRRVEAEAMRPQMSDDSPDGFDAARFGPSGRRLWMQLDADRGMSGSREAYERGRQQLRSNREAGAS